MEESSVCGVFIGLPVLLPTAMPVPYSPFRACKDARVIVFFLCGRSGRELQPIAHSDVFCDLVLEFRTGSSG